MSGASMQDTIAVVTGGAGHIGREIGRKLAARGSHVVILDKDKASGTAFAAELRETYGNGSHFLDADLMDPESFARIHDALKEKHGKVDFIVNNAAFYDDAPGWGVPFDQEGYEAWVKVMRVNLLAPFFLVQKLAPLLAKSDCASVVNVSTVYALGGPDHRLYEGTDMTNPAAYAASKGGLLSLTKWLGAVLAPRVRVNAVIPGGVQRGQPDSFLERYHARTPMQRMAKDGEVADAIVFLLSPEASYITGHDLVVDGGWTAW